MKRLHIILMLLLIASSTVSFAKIPFSRGVNLTKWFEARSVQQIKFAKYTKQDLINIKSLGCDVIRLPINLHYMTTGNPDYKIDPLFFQYLDQVVSWAEALKIYLILDNHSFNPSVSTDANIETILVKVWGQMAEHYQSRSKYILYEILNEPHGISAELWGRVQQSAINAIRAVDARHTIIVGGVNYNSYTRLDSIPRYSDKNLIYTFHFYDPFVFTHQGASWTTPSMVPLSGVPFPYQADKMPTCPPPLLGTWLQYGLKNYVNEGNAAKVKSLLDVAVNFKKSRKVDLYCGEFGVYIPNSDNSDRLAWYNIVRNYLEENRIAWTTWDYQGGFGLFKKDTKEIFSADLNIELLQSLDFKVPKYAPQLNQSQSD